MKKLFFLIMGILFPIASLFAQEAEKNDEPDEQIIVNKEYDNEGNLIGYDSTHVSKWSSDTTLQLPFGIPHFGGDDFPGMEELFSDFFGDSARFNFNFPGNMQMPMWDGDKFMDQFSNMFPDSLFKGDFNFRTDSVFGNLPSDSLFQLHDNRIFPDLKIMEELMKEQFRKQEFREFKSPEQKSEWENLMQKHREAIREFQKRWEDGSD